ncbi:MAG: response regulator [Lachnospiraceae bacterium]|nr:response regulator [Lachnospiraceae bacterium]
MYKVVIIDDEPIIVEGLSKAVDWKSLNCTVAGCAPDGQKGIELIRNVEPDIVISDICMPGLNGLKMIAALRSEYPRMQITILTGYREFEYAREAISLGVTRFLLKPSKMDELQEAIRAMCEKLSDADEKGSHPSDDTSTEAGGFVVKNALHYMREHYDQKLLLSDVADEIYVSQWHLSKLLNKETGQSFSEIMNGIRIEKAKELLKDPSLRISDIAESVGFQDLPHFSRVFKKIAGVSANEYRNRPHV